MATAVKRKLSGSTDGVAIKITGIEGTSGTNSNLIHTGVSGTTNGTYDEVWLWAYNSHSANIALTVQFGGTSSPDNDIKVTIPYQSGLIPVLPGLIIQNSKAIRAYAGSSGVITVSGFVNSITD